MKLSHVLFLSILSFWRGLLTPYLSYFEFFPWLCNNLKPNFARLFHMRLRLQFKVLNFPVEFFTSNDKSLIQHKPFGHLRILKYFCHENGTINDPREKDFRIFSIFWKRDFSPMDVFPGLRSFFRIFVQIIVLRGRVKG